VESEPSLDAEHTSVSCIMRREIGPEDSWHDGCMWTGLQKGKEVINAWSTREYRCKWSCFTNNISI